MKKFWVFFFFFWPTVALICSWYASDLGWWFPSEAMSPLGERIDGLFELILWIVTAFMSVVISMISALA